MDSVRPYERVTGLDALQAGLEKVRRNGGGPGGDGVTVQDIVMRSPAALIDLQRAIRNGTYRPGPIRKISMAKKSGGYRTLSIPSTIDRVAQSAVAQFLQEHLEPEMEDSSHGYRPGQSVQSAVRQISHYRQKGFEWVIDADIKSYFDNVAHKPLLERVSQSIADSDLLDLISLWLEASGEDGLGLPQGSPISPVLANLYLDGLDEKLSHRDHKIVRFADDFVVLCRNEKIAGRALEKVRDELDRLGLSLNLDKTHVTKFDRGFRFLGRIFVRSLVMDDLWDELCNVPGSIVEDAAIIAGQGDQLIDEPTAPVRIAQRPLYVVTPGVTLTRRHNTFQLMEGERPVLSVPTGHVGRIDLFPGTSADDEALRHALASKTPIHYANGQGGTIGTLLANPAERARLHLEQARLALDEQLRVAAARTLVQGRIHNQRALLRRLNRKRKLQDVAHACEKLNRILRKLPIADRVEQLMGHEGEAAAIYWPAWGACLEHGWTFSTRRRQPPPNPVNVVLSFTASLLYRDMETAIARRGLHPGFCVLHSVRDGHNGCASDLIEEFRAPLCEGLSLYIFNNRIVSKDDFLKASEEGVRIVPRGRDAVIKAYEHWLERPVMSPRLKHKVSWRSLMDEQTLNFVDACREGGDYAPYRMDY